MAVKVTQIAKDMNIKPKEVTDFLKSIALDKKTVDQLDADEWSLFLDRLTKQNQIENIDDYLDGKATLRVDRPAPVKKAEAPKEEKKSEAPAAETQEVKEKAQEKKESAPEKQVQEQPMQAEAKPAEKPQQKPEEKVEAKAELNAETKAEEKQPQS